MRTSNILRLLVLAIAAVSSVSAHEDAVHHERQLSVAQHGVVSGLQNHVMDESHVSRILKKKHKATPPPEDEEEEEEEEEAGTSAPAPAATPTPVAQAPVAPVAQTEPATAPVPAATTTQPASTTAPAPVATTVAPPAPTSKPSSRMKEPVIEETKEELQALNDTRIKGNTNEGVIDGSSEGSAEIDKIDLRNKDKWVSVYNDPPLLVIKASLYAFISYNNSEVCDSFNMTLNAVEEKDDAVEKKDDGNGTFSYHIVTYINCTKNGYDETPGRFILNFIPEGNRLLLTECGHREESEIVNWLKITDEVPECMTPAERRAFIAQPMKHIHASNGTAGVAPVQTDFMTRLEEGDVKEVAIVGSATVALIAVIVVIAVFIGRKRKAQKDLERTIAGAKADHADEDEDKSEKEDDSGLIENETTKSSDVQEEGSFVNSPAVKV